MSQIGGWGRIAVLATCGAALGSVPAAAQQAPLMVDVSGCVGLAVAVQRLACYDALGHDSLQPSGVTNTDSAELTEPLAAAPAVAEFGQQAPGAAARVTTNGEGESELVDRIVDLQERVPGRFLITLASGQVWYQANSQRLRLRKGMQVRIYPSPLGGSWRMARADGGQSGFIQVSRVE